MHYWTCITQYKLRALSNLSKNSQAKFKWTEADRHICALKAGCGFKKMSTVTLTCSNFIYLCTCLLSPPLCRNVLDPQTGGEAGHGCMHQFRVSASVHQPSPPIGQKEGVSGWKRSTGIPWELPLGPVSFWTHINFGSLISSGEEFLSFKVPQIFTALGPLREKQVFSHSFWLYRVSASDGW